jgi:hypothetical protein
MSGAALTCYFCLRRRRRCRRLLFPCYCSAPSLPKLDSHSVIKFPLTTESAMKKIEDNNTLVSPACQGGREHPHGGSRTRSFHPLLHGCCMAAAWLLLLLL